MKNLFRKIIFLAMGLLLIACEQSTTATTSPIPSPSVTQTSTIVPITTPTAIATIEPTPRPEYVPPTLFPTIDPTLAPDLLRNTFTIQTVNESQNNHRTRRIYGWAYGFRHRCSSFQWLDSTHIMLFPSTGQYDTNNFGVFDNTSSVVINLDTGKTWLPSYSPSGFCTSTPWSHELGMLVLPSGESISIYGPDGNMINQYLGKLIDVSPSGTKILINDNTWVDLKSGKRVDFAWSKESEEKIYPIYHPIWSSDEMQVSHAVINTVMPKLEKVTISPTMIYSWTEKRQQAAYIIRMVIGC